MVQPFCLPRRQQTTFIGYRGKPVVTKGIPLITSIGSLRFTEYAVPGAGRLLTVDTTTRRTAPALFFVLMLAIAVFSWGLHYKMSLYCPKATQSNVPVAKLLSQKERPVSPKDLSSARSTSPQPQSSTPFSIFLIATIAAGVSFVLSISIRTVTTIDDSRNRSCAVSYCFSPRPPPAASLPS